MQWLRALPSFFSSSWVVYLGLGLGLLCVGGYLGYKTEHQLMLTQLLQVQSSFDQYKLVVVQDAAQASAETVSKLQMAQTHADDLARQLTQKQNQLRSTSESLTQALNNATQTSILSPAVIDYLNRLRISQTRADH